MEASGSGRKARQQAHRRGWLIALLLIYGAVLIFETLRPFDFSLKAFSEKANQPKRIEFLPFTNICPKHGFFCPWDWGTNLPLLAPVAVLIVLLSNPAAATARRVGKATLLCFIISVAIETAQLFVPSRLPSATDVLQNTLGAFVAAWLTVRLSGRST